MRIGFIFIHIVPMKVAKKMNRLMKNCHGFMLGWEKLSTLQSSNVAAANSPTTTGRRPAIMDCVIDVFIYLKNILQMRSIMMNDGRIIAMVAVTLPSTAIIPFIPALCTAVYPQ